MIVYHASNRVIEKPDVSFSREALDFGRGFYVTIFQEQAIKYARRFLLRDENAFINRYELNDAWREQKVKVFLSYDEDWLDFVAANRALLSVEPFDAVEGGVANDKIFRTLDLYFANEISKSEALNRLKFEKPNHQICLRSQKLIDECLFFLDFEAL